MIATTTTVYVRIGTDTLQLTVADMHKRFKAEQLQGSTTQMSIESVVRAPFPHVSWFPIKAVTEIGASTAYLITLETGGVDVTSESQLLSPSRGFVTTRELAPGDYVAVRDTATEDRIKWVAVKSAMQYDILPAFDIVVDGCDNYIANGVVLRCHQLS